MHRYWFPKYLCSRLDRITRDFIWKGFEFGKLVWELLQGQNKGSGWSPPNEDCMILNIVVQEKAGFGGVLRTHEGSWVLGYCGNLDVAEVIEAELMGILQGLRFCHRKGMTKVHCQPLSGFWEGYLLCIAMPIWWDKFVISCRCKGRSQSLMFCVSAISVQTFSRRWGIYVVRI
ncbi:Reverse transcriptase-like [Sesbania bispinosa]|nr:Reverse transcriptase-like [Sesbania bispinosa]